MVESMVLQGLDGLPRSDNRPELSEVGQLQRGSGRIGVSLNATAVALTGRGPLHAQASCLVTVYQSEAHVQGAFAGFVEVIDDFLGF